MKRRSFFISFYALLSIFSSSYAGEQKRSPNEGLLTVIVEPKYNKRHKTQLKGTGIIISSDGEFIVNRTLVHDALKKSYQYDLKVLTPDGEELSDLKLSSCSLNPEIDLCLMKADYSPLIYFKVLDDDKKEYQKAFVFDHLIDLHRIEKNESRKKDDKQKPEKFVTIKKELDPNFVEYYQISEGNFSEESIGSPLYDEQRNLLGQLSNLKIQNDYKNRVKALSSSEISLFIIQNRIFQPIKRNKSSGDMMSEIASLLQNNKSHPNASIGDLRRLRAMEEAVQEFNPNYKAEMDSKGLEDLKNKFQVLNELRGLGSNEHSTSARSKENQAKQLVQKRKSIKVEIEKASLELSEIEEKMNANVANQKILSQIDKMNKQLKSLQKRISANKKSYEKKKKNISHINDKKEKTLMMKGLVLMSDNIKSDTEKMEKIKGKITALKKLSKGNPAQERYKTKQEELRILNGKLKGLDQKAFEIFEDAI